MLCVQLGYRETKRLRKLLWIRLCQTIDIHIIWMVIMPCWRPFIISGLENDF